MAGNGKRIHNRMSQSKYEKLQDYLWDLKTNVKNRGLKNDLRDYDRYNSAGGERAVGDERLREMDIYKEKTPSGPVADKNKAWLRMRELRRKRRSGR